MAEDQPHPRRYNQTSAGLLTIPTPILIEKNYEWKCALSVCEMYEEMKRVYQRQSYNSATYSSYNSGSRAIVRYVNQCQLFQESLERNQAIFLLSHPTFLPLIPLFASPLWCTFDPSLRMFHRGPDSSESSDIPLACSNTWGCRYWFRGSTGD